MVTLKDIAKETKTSITTVSKVISGSAYEVGIKPETQKLILQVAKELNYYPHGSARSLKLGKSNTIGVVACDMREPYYGDILTGVEEEAKSAGYFCMLSTVEEDIERGEAYLRMFRQRRVDGILIIGAPLELRDDSISQLAKENIPVVFIGKRTENFSIPYAAVENHTGGFLAAEHLIGLGHRKIAFINGTIGKTETIESRERFEGYRAALEKHEAPYDENLIEAGRLGNAAMDSGYQCMTRLLSKPEPPTAVFAFDDLMAIGVMKAVRDKGLKVPADISVVGFDNIALSAYSDPPLTTVEQPMVEMGRGGARLLIDFIGRKGAGMKHNIVLQPRLIVRESTGVCGGAAANGKNRSSISSFVPGQI